MELARVFLYSALFLILFMLWNAWQNDYPKMPASTPAPVTTPVTKLPNQAVIPNAVPAVAAPAVNQPAQQVVSGGKLIQVHTDVLDVVIDTVGGNIIKASLLNYPEKDQHDKTPFQLLNDTPATLYVAQSGLIGSGGPDTQSGQAIYTAKQTKYTLPEGQKELIVDLQWQGKNGLVVHKKFLFSRDDYLIKVDYQIDNRSSTAWTGQLYTQLERKKVEPPDQGFFVVNPFIGAAISSPEKHYQKLSFDDMSKKNLSVNAKDGWAAMVQHYFLSAWIPPNNETFNYYSQVSNGDVYTLGMIGPAMTVAAGAQMLTGARLYVGPEIMDRLKAVAPSLDLTIDYGILWFISAALFWFMKEIYNFVGNWGWSIVLVTLAVKILFYHLSAKSYRSMAAMRNLQPRLQMLKERYGEDRQKLTQATMELYKQEKINPFGGCLPVLVQIPVFIALYWVLLESVELRQAPFILWIHDLSVKDPYFVLPILMGLTMFIQQRLNPPPPDPMQAKIMQFLPVVFTFLFFNFPAGLVLYWVVNNTLSILQQWYIMNKAEVVKIKKK